MMSSVAVQMLFDDDHVQEKLASNEDEGLSRSSLQNASWNYGVSYRFRVDSCKQARSINSKQTKASEAPDKPGELLKKQTSRPSLIPIICDDRPSDTHVQNQRVIVVVMGVDGAVT